MFLMFNIYFYFTHHQKSSKLSLELLVKDLLIGLLYAAVYGDLTLLEQVDLLTAVFHGWQNSHVHLQVAMLTQ